MQKPREIAVRIFQRRQGAGDYTETLLDSELTRADLSPVDRRLCHELVLGVVRWQAALDWLIARKTPARLQPPLLQTLLRLGLYQIFFLDRIPGHAAVYETVELAKQNGFARQAGFVNALLRGYLRESDTTRKLLAELKSSQPALGFSHPDWLVRRWHQHWGGERARALLEWNNTPPPTFARLNTLRTDAEKLLGRWRAEGVECDVVRRDWFEDDLVFELKSHPPLAALPSFADGWFYLQDPGTLLAVRELDPQPGEMILDLCAAPGGKTTLIAQVVRNQGRIIAHDIAPERVTLIEENCARLGATCVQAVSDSSSFRQHPSFDRVLVDAPCSNTGVLRRRVDLRWRIRAEEIGRLHQVQLGLLGQAAALLRPGGVLVYSTCSLEPEENSQVVGEFLQAHEHFSAAHERELLPFADGVDGAFVTRLRRAE